MRRIQGEKEEREREREGGREGGKCCIVSKERIYHVIYALSGHRTKLSWKMILRSCHWF